VLDAVKSIGTAGPVVLGNHDRNLLALALAPCGVRWREKELETVLDAPDAAELLAWLAARPLLHRERGISWTLIHAGLPPDWTLAEAESVAREVERALRDDAAGLLDSMYGDAPDRWSASLAGEERLRFIVNCLTRLRFVDHKGRLVLSHKGTIGDAPKGAIPWFRHPERATRKDVLVFGHWSALGYLSEPGLLCLDTGCVWGGALTAQRLDRESAPVCLPCRQRRTGAH
jgi:bis(5'-nucleosyl)-tetraphosphatase (symmetrical)